MSTTFITEWAKGQQPKAQALKEASVFYRNLEEELDVRRSQHAYVPLHTSDLNIDLASHDSLALDSSGTMRTAFLDELAQYPDFRVGSRGSRVASGNSSFFEQVEQEIADFHGAEAALILENGCLCNGVIFSTIPRPGDAIVYDELVHASIHDGMKDSLALCQKSFRHNNVDSFIDTLQSIRDSQPLIDNGSRTVLVAVESFYSMDGDVCPLQELVEAAREVLPDGNAQFIIDEAQSTGVIGPNGAGLVCALGLENEVAIKLHTFSKALAAFGGEATSSRIYADIDAGCKLMLTLAAILCSKTVKATLLNFARSITFSQAPTFPMLAAIRSAYKLQRSPQAQQARDRVQYVVKLFVSKMTEHPLWDAASDAGILRIPLFELESPESMPFLSPLVPIWTRPQHNFYLSFHLHLAGMQAFPFTFPVVPKGTQRVRLGLKASHTDEQVDALVACIFAWAEEMMELDRNNGGIKLPRSARQAFSLLARSTP